MAAVAHARAADQTLAAAAHGIGARARAWCRVCPERDLPDRLPPTQLLLHHAAVPAVLGACDCLRDLRRGTPPRQLPEADAVRARTLPTRQQHRERGRG